MASGIYSLHFYPEMHCLEVLDSSGSVVDRFEAWGGDVKEARAGTPGYTETKPGTYVVGEIKPHVSTRWPLSGVVWKGDVEAMRIPDSPMVGMAEYFIFDKAGKRLGTISEPDFQSAFAHMPDKLDAAVRGETITIPSYFNDFGHTSIKVFVDKNGDGILNWNKGETFHHDFIHPTPESEWAEMHGRPRPALGYSHGCIHIHPGDIDILVSKYVKPFKTTLTVH